MVTAPVRREVVRAMMTRGVSERRASTVVRMSASALGYVPAPDRNAALLRAVDLAPDKLVVAFAAGLVLLTAGVIGGLSIRILRPRWPPRPVSSLIL
jgi:hypothetical protein